MKDNEKFEEKMKRLEKIVEKFEKEELGLEDSLKYFQEGMALGAECKKILDDIELKVQKILKDEDMKVEPWTDDVEH
jgi:exodeoxyribonuclease VII small subunit